MIDEKKLIEDLEKLKQEVNMPVDIVWNNLLKVCIDTVNEQTKVGEWIPVEVELPKYNDEYNVTVGVASEFGYFEKVTTLRYRIVKGEEAKWILPTHDVYTVIAWQPLPAPTSRIFPLAMRNASCSIADISSNERNNVSIGIASSSNIDDNTRKRAALPVRA